MLLDQARWLWELIEYV